MKKIISTLALCRLRQGIRENNPVALKFCEHNGITKKQIKEFMKKDSTINDFVKITGIGVY